MIIKINGKEETIGGKIKLSEFISSKELSCERIVIEHNLRIVPKEEWPQITLEENDNLEIVSFVAGG